MGTWFNIKMQSRLKAAASESMKRAYLSDEISVESESDVGRVTPVDDGDTRPVSSHVQSLDDPLHKVQHVVPPLCVHCAGGIQYERQINFSAASYNKIIATARNHRSHSQPAQRTTANSEYMEITQHSAWSESNRYQDITLQRSGDDTIASHWLQYERSKKKFSLMPHQNYFVRLAHNSAPDQPSMSTTNGQDLAHVAEIALGLEKKWGLSECQGSASRNSSSSEIAWHSSHGARLLSTVNVLAVSLFR